MIVVGSVFLLSAIQKLAMLPHAKVGVGVKLPVYFLCPVAAGAAVV